MLEKAILIAEIAFIDKVDKAGEAYLWHLERVASNFESEILKTIAYLHDILEDCYDWNEERLSEHFPDSVVKAVICLTHKEGQSYDDYISQVMENDLSVIVKMADLKDNMDLTRLETITDSDIERTKKYHSAFKRLNNLN